MLKLRIFFAIASLCVICSVANAQQTGPCPAVSMSGPSGFVDAGNIAMYTVFVRDYRPSIPLSYTWSTSVGNIKRGQGTTQIEVVQPDAMLTVTVLIGGLPEGCPNSWSEATPCALRAPEAVKLIEISGSLSEDKFRLMRKAIGTVNDPYGQIHVIVYGNNEEIVKKRADSLKKLFRRDSTRATFFIVGYDEELTAIWFVPAGAKPPRQ